MAGPFKPRVLGKAALFISLKNELEPNKTQNWSFVKLGLKTAIERDDSNLSNPEMTESRVKAEP